ncbi:MAG: 2-amino-4-hydroxy-6-hydroxymethyldihydropteridine diphosphokinase [Hylemonella sp.]|nr:2-amino-4-hydroxy-6-hydroxymethyldihydropteridine diphosphokinase [Hylemonella sp.]
MATTAYIALGANLGQARETVRQAIQAVAALPGLELRRCSSLYRTAPLDASGPDFINAVIEVATTLAPHDLLAALQGIEQAAGRQRPYRNAPRTLDLDILLYGDQAIDSATLTIPHPRMTERAFVLVPLAQIAPQQVTAQQLRSVQTQVIERLAD